MDFVKLLNNSIEVHSKKSKETVNQRKKEEVPINHTFYEDIKVGDYIKIVYLENSQYNDYKGYIGEVKEYKRGKDRALIMIHSTNIPKFIKISLKHFIKI